MSPEEVGYADRFWSDLMGSSSRRSTRPESVARGGDWTSIESAFQAESIEAPREAWSRAEGPARHFGESFEYDGFDHDSESFEEDDGGHEDAEARDADFGLAFGEHGSARERECEADEDYGVAGREDDAGEAVVVDAAAAVPPFSAAERANVLSTRLSSTNRSAAVTWNRTKHPTDSGVTLDEIRGALGSYVDMAAVATAIGVAATTEEALAEAIHQFQLKCFNESSQRDGKAGESTLDCLGLIARSGMRTVNRVNTGRTAYLATRDAEIRRISSGEFTAATWYDFMVHPAFLGWRFSNGVHLDYIRKLRLAERYLLSLPAYAGRTPVEIARLMGITEGHGGHRPTSTSKSHHTLGLASDMNYMTTPWVVDPDKPAGTTAFIEVMKRASWLVSGWTGRVDGAYLAGLGSSGRSTADIYDELRSRSQELVQYLALNGNATGIAAAMAARTGTPPAGLPTTATAWQSAIAADLATLRDPANTFGTSGGGVRDPRRGFLGHHRDLVIAIRDAACMAWGAVDFGPRASGDVMHFDTRRAGLGQALNERGYRTAVPCPTITAGMSTMSSALTSAAVGAMAGAAAGVAAGVAVGLGTGASTKR